MLPLLAESVARRGIEVEVAATDDNGPERLDVPLGKPTLQNEVVYHYFPRQTRFYTVSTSLARWLAHSVRDYQLLHLHALFTYSTTIAAQIARAQHVPYLVRPLGILNHWGMHNRRPLLKMLSYRLIERRILEGSAAVQYTTEQEMTEAAELGFHAPSVVVPNPVDTGLYSTSAPDCFRTQFPDLKGRLLLLYLSRLDEKKGLDLLVPAFAKLARRIPEASLVIAGSGSPEITARVKGQVQALGLEQSVLFVPFLRGSVKVGALAAADLFVLPSRSENFGVAVVEAMAAGCPVVVTDQVGLHREVARYGAGIVAECTVESLYEALLRVAESRDDRRRMSDAARRLAAEHYDTSVVAGKLVELYQSVAGR